MGALWWFVIGSLVGVIVSLCPTNTQYTIPTFGGNCSYRCHCAGDVQCDPSSGECPSGCENGWMGPACQYRNVAMNQTSVSQHGNAALDTIAASNAVDGNMATCSKTNPSSDGGEQYLWIQLDRVYYIVGLLIHLPPGDSLGSFRVEAANTTSFNLDDVRLCVRYGSGPGTDIIEVMCIEPMLASVLRIVRQDDINTLSLCEVQIYGGRHISFNQNTTQQSTLIYGDHTWNSRLAVDGTGAVTTENEGHGYTCSATNYGVGERWWQLDLLTKYRIEDIYIFSRLDSLKQTAGFTLTIDSENIYNDEPSSNERDYLPRTLNITEPLDGQSIRLTKQSILVLCEVIVYGECLPNSCGLNCTDVCMCSSVTTGTPRLRGVCPHGCTGRWTGADGRCDIECSTTEWGPYCNNTCGHCANNDTCDVKTGMCPQGCPPSWKPGLCTNKCDDGWWGSNCTNMCGNCTDGTPCDKIDGTCAAGCHSGYKPLRCTEECDAGMYGDNCSSVCGKCTEANEMTSCRPDTGVCPGGCQPGLKPPNCHDECDDSWWGSNCSSSCGNCTDDGPCNKKNGTCPGGCLLGYQPPFCKEECTPGSYGLNCTYECGNCTETDRVTTCRPDTGDCPAGCPIGLQPPKCQAVCREGFYGNNCNSSCGQCSANTVCHHVTGVCPQGCQDGYQGDTCHDDCGLGLYGQNCSAKCGQCSADEASCNHVTGVCSAGCLPECDESWWGSNCSSSCGNCTDDRPCDKIDGTCPGGCLLGYKPPFCKEECNSGTFGGNCSQTCGNCSGIIMCDHVTGRCPSGCDPGFRGDTCSELSTQVANSGEEQHGFDVLLHAVIPALCLCIVVLLAIIGGCTSVHWRKSTRTQTVRSTRALTDRQFGTSLAEIKEARNGPLSETGNESGRIYTTLDEVGNISDRMCLSGTAILPSRDTFQRHDMTSTIAKTADDYESLRRDAQSGNLYSQLDNNIVTKQSSIGSANVEVPSQDSVYECTASDQEPASCLPSGEYQSLHAKRGTSATYTSLQETPGSEMRHIAKAQRWPQP